MAEPVPDGADPLASGRVTLLGTLAAVGDDEREVARPLPHGQPVRPYYIEFGDFKFYRLWVESIRYVGGYGR